MGTAEATLSQIPKTYHRKLDWITKVVSRSTRR